MNHYLGSFLTQQLRFQLFLGLLAALIVLKADFRYSFMVRVCTFSMIIFCICANLRAYLIVLFESDDEVLIEFLKKLLSFDFNIMFRLGNFIVEVDRHRFDNRQLLWKHVFLIGTR